MRKNERTLPRTGSERWALGVASLLFGILFGFMASVVFLTRMPGLGVFFILVLIATEELLLAGTVVAVLGVIWAVATPSWVEGLFRSAWKKIFVAILLGLVPIVILILLQVFGITLRPEVGP